MEPSTRTRIAFELAAKTLHADVISIAEKSSSLTKGETLRDTALNIQALGADAIVLRHSSPGSPLLLSRIIDVPIINASKSGTIGCIHIRRKNRTFGWKKNNNFGRYTF